MNNYGKTLELLSRIEGGLYSLFYAPSLLSYSLPKSNLFKTILLGKPCEGKRVSFVGKLYSRPPVVRLFFSGSPTTIFLRIISVVVDSFYRCIKATVLCIMDLITFVHIVSKLSKRIPRTLYSSACVVLKFVRFCITDSIYSNPNFMEMRTTEKVSSFGSLVRTLFRTVPLLRFQGSFKGLFTYRTDFFHTPILPGMPRSCKI